MNPPNLASEPAPCYADLPKNPRRAWLGGQVRWGGLKKAPYFFDWVGPYLISQGPPKVIWGRRIQIQQKNPKKSPRGQNGEGKKNGTNRSWHLNLTHATLVGGIQADPCYARRGRIERRKASPPVTKLFASQSPKDRLAENRATTVGLPLFMYMQIIYYIRAPHG